VAIPPCSQAAHRHVPPVSATFGGCSCVLMVTPCPASLLSPSYIHPAVASGLADYCCEGWCCFSACILHADWLWLVGCACCAEQVSVSGPLLSSLLVFSAQTHQNENTLCGCCVCALFGECLLAAVACVKVVVVQGAPRRGWSRVSITCAVFIFINLVLTFLTYDGVGA